MSGTVLCPAPHRTRCSHLTNPALDYYFILSSPSPWFLDFGGSNYYCMVENGG